MTYVLGEMFTKVKPSIQLKLGFIHHKVIMGFQWMVHLCGDTDDTYQCWASIHLGEYKPMLGGYHKEGKVLNQVFNQLRTNMKNLTR
jgi:hypothetical protein